MSEKNTFEKLNISDEILKGLSNIGYKSPSEVQEKVIPIALEAKDIVVQSKTGTGKTAAYGIPIGELLSADQRELQCLVLTPTRELAIQVSDEISNITKFKRLRAVPIYGGQLIDGQIKTLKQRTHIVVGTPGRILDHIERGTIELSDLKCLVIDEVDKMCDMGFLGEVEKILEFCDSNKQVMIFSATISDEVHLLSQRYMKDVAEILLSPEEITVEAIEQKACIVSEESKFEDFCKIIYMEKPDTAIVFCRTKSEADSLEKQMKAKGLSSGILHGDMEQKARNQAVQDFKENKFDFLVATDIAARGLDIKNVTHVFNYDIPLYSESYVHRIGRTGRAGNTGKAITILVNDEIKYLGLIEEYIGMRIERVDVPNINRIERFNIDKKNNDNKFSNKALAEKNENKFDKEITRLFINLGRKNKIRAFDIVGAILNLAKIPTESIGIIDIYDNYTFVDIMDGYGETVIVAMKDGKIKGKRVKVQKAK